MSPFLCKHIGELSEQQAIMIHKEGREPEELPVLRQMELDVYYDPEALERLGIVFPETLLKIAKPARITDGSLLYWQADPQGIGP